MVIKAIVIFLITTNYVEDKRFSTVAYTTGDGAFAGDVIASNGSSAPISLLDIGRNYASKEYVDSKEFESIILKSSNKKFRLTIDNEGTLTATEIIGEEG